MKKSIKISILVLAHNVEEYIAEALDSILVQDVNFDYEILIGDDYATDGTRAIIQEYQRRYPEKITLYLTDQNRGNAFNFVNLQRNAKGVYFTVLDGDDYWIDKNKLQKQINFLDVNPEFTVCGHNSYLRYEEEGSRIEKMHGREKNNYSFVCNDFKDLLLGGKCPYMHTSSLIYRKDPMQDIDFEQWQNKCYAGDVIRTFFYGEKGSVKYLNEVMSVYRIHKGGAYTSLSDSEKKIKEVEFFLWHKNHSFKNRYGREFDEVIIRQIDVLGELHKSFFPFKLKYAFLKKYLKLKSNQEKSKMCNTILMGSNFILFYIMSIFVGYKDWK